MIPSTAVLLSLLLLPAAMVAQSVDSSTSPRWAAQDTSWDVSLSLTKNSLEVRFPPIPVSKIGCPFPDTWGGAKVRGYQWQVTSAFADTSVGGSHFMYAGAYLTLPATLEMTKSRLDSLLGSAQVAVDEAGGEPPMRISGMTPERASLRYVDGRVVLRIDDPMAVKEFRRAGGVSGLIFWCQRDVQMNFARRPLAP